MCIVGKMTQDVGWCESVGLVGFEASIPTCTCFHEGKLFVTCFCCFFSFLYCRLGMVREERWEGRPRGRCMVNFFVIIKVRTIIKTPMLPSEIVDPYLTLLYLWGFRSYKSPAHFVCRFTEYVSVVTVTISCKTPLQQQFDGE